MAIRTIDWVTPTWISCAGQLLCGGANTMPVILCVVAGKAINSPPGMAQGSILGALTKVISVPSTCGGAVSYKYTFSYDDDQTGATILVAADILGVVCDGCLTSWVRDQDLALQLSGVIYDGAECLETPVSGTETDLPDLALDVSIFANPAIFGPRSLLLQFLLKVSIGYELTAYTHFQFQARFTIDGVVGAWTDIDTVVAISPVGARTQYRKQVTNIEGIGLYPPTALYIASGDTAVVHVDFRVATPVLNAATVYASATELFGFHWAI